MADNLKFKIKIGEIGKVIQFTIKDENGATVSLTGKTVYFTLKRGAATALSLGVCTNAADQTADKGECSYTFGTEVNSFTAGRYLGELCVEDAGGNLLFYPNNETASQDYISVTVTASLAVPA